MDVRHKSHVFFVYIPFFMFVHPASTFAGELTIASEAFFCNILKINQNETNQIKFKECFLLPYLLMDAYFH